MKTARPIRALLFLSILLSSLPSFAQVFQLTGQIKTVAGDGTPGSGGDGSSATAAQLGYFVSGTALDATKNLYIADNNNNRIRKVSTGGNITTVVGTGTAGYTGDGGAATAATIDGPIGIVFDSAGNMFFSESTNQVIRKVDTSGNISTEKVLAFAPGGIAIDSANNIYIANPQNNQVWKLDSSQNLTLFAGTGTAGYTGDNAAATSATLNGPNAVAVDSADAVYISDGLNHAIRKVTTGGTITTVAGIGSAGYGGDGGLATNAKLSGPAGLAVDPLGDIYIADSNNQVIREVDTAGIIRTLAGTGSAGHTGDGGPGLAAQLYNPKFPTIDSSSLTLYFSDTSSYTVRALGTPTSLDFGNQSVGTTSTALPTEVFNASFQSGTIGTISATGDFAVTNAGSCSTGAAFDAGAICSVFVTFTPTLSGPRTGTLSIAGGGNGTQTLPLAGVGQIVTVATTTVLVPSKNPALTSDTFTLTATVTPASGTAIPTGTVDFKDGSTSLGSVAVDAAGTATLTNVQFATQGTYSLTADYSGDTNFDPSTSAAVSEVINPAPIATTTALGSSKNPALTTDTITLTATVTPVSGTSVPTGTVDFKNGATSLGTAPVNASGVATLAGVQFTTQASYSLTAVYSGDSSFTTSTSVVLSEVINTPAQIGTTTSLSSSKNPATTTDTLTLTANVAPASGTAVPTGTVTFKSGAASLGTGALDNTGKATLSGIQFTTAATYSLTAVYAGDTNFTGSTSSVVSENITSAPDFTITVNPNVLNIGRGGTGSATITVTPINGFTGSVKIGCAGLPAGTACRLNPVAITVGAGPATGTLTIATNTLASVSVPSDGNYLASNSQNKHLPLSTLLGTGVFGLVFAAGATGLRKPDSRKRKLMGLLLLGLILTSVLIMPGCLNMSGPKSPLGSSTVMVSATSAASGSVSHSAPLSVTIHD
jgi:hypothetical protein